MILEILQVDVKSLIFMCNAVLKGSEGVSQIRVFCFAGLPRVVASHRLTHNFKIYTA